MQDQSSLVHRHHPCKSALFCIFLKCWELCSSHCSQGEPNSLSPTYWSQVIWKYSALQSLPQALASANSWLFPKHDLFSHTSILDTCFHFPVMPVPILSNWLTPAQTSGLWKKHSSRACPRLTLGYMLHSVWIDGKRQLTLQTVWGCHFTVDTENIVGTGLGSLVQMCSMYRLSCK